MTTNIQLENFMKKHANRLKNRGEKFLGVFPSDQLPDPKSFHKACLISNYSPEDDKGTHWIAMRNLNNPNGTPAEYFDSYGLHPDEADSMLGLKTNFKDYLCNDFIYNKIDLQAWGADDECGEYCILFIVHGEPRMSDPVWAKFLCITDKHKRDLLVKKYIGIRKK